MEYAGYFATRSTSAAAEVYGICFLKPKEGVAGHELRGIFWQPKDASAPSATVTIESAAGVAENRRLTVERLEFDRERSPGWAAFDIYGLTGSMDAVFVRLTVSVSRSGAVVAQGQCKAEVQLNALCPLIQLDDQITVEPTFESSVVSEIVKPRLREKLTVSIALADGTVLGSEQVDSNGQAVFHAGLQASAALVRSSATDRTRPLFGGRPRSHRRC